MWRYSEEVHYIIGRITDSFSYFTLHMCHSESKESIFLHAIIRIRLCFSCRWGVTIILYIAYAPRIEHYIVCPASSHTQFVQFLYTINMFFSHIWFWVSPTETLQSRQRDNNGNTSERTLQHLSCNSVHYVSIRNWHTQDVKSWNTTHSLKILWNWAYQGPWVPFHCNNTVKKKRLVVKLNNIQRKENGNTEV